jgi:cAMP-dependent protein kinase regulator
MKEVKVQAGEKVIEQGAVGDYFYVVEEGSLDVFKAKPGEETAPGDIGAKVYTNLPGTSFGELALMYK